MELREKDLLKLKQDLYGEEFKCGYCIDYPDVGIVCGENRAVCDKNEEACVFFIKSGNSKTSNGIDK